MYDDGYHNIVNVDYSPVVIEQMASKYADCIGMTCKSDTLFSSLLKSFLPSLSVLTILLN